MNAVLKEIIKSLRENWQEWEYTVYEDDTHHEIHKLSNDASGIKMFMARRGKRLLYPEPNKTGFYRESSFRYELGFWTTRAVNKSMMLCISKIIASNLKPEKNEVVGKAIRHLDLDE